MHVTLFGSAVWLWSGLLAPRPPAGAIGAAALSMIQMSLIGALITLAPQPLYSPHLLTTAAWGLTPLGDQQLGGALMWAPGGLAFLAAALVIGWRFMGERRAAPPLAPGLAATR
jgi:putative membrane protein